MRMNYISLPTDYVIELQVQGKREKGRAFMEYFLDMEVEAVNSLSFYGVSWGAKDKPMNKGSVSRWVAEFKYEIAKYFNLWELKNAQHYSYVKNAVQPQCNPKETKHPLETTKTMGFEELCATSMQPQSNQALNNYHHHNAGFISDKNFNDLYFVYSHNTKFTGKKEEAYNAFVHVKVDNSLLKLAAMKYLHDPEVKKPFGLKKFLENQSYLAYMPKYVRVNNVKDNQWYEGIYDSTTFELKAYDGKPLGTIKPDLLVKLYEDKCLEFLSGPTQDVS
ncbi:MAG: hypothetical protein COA44_06115 [Arcobacter sp.]|nr:MAG: hypothetical protein COA44_06115 [Arcobacter sp.]